MKLPLTSFVSFTTTRCLNPRALKSRNTRGKEADCQHKKQYIHFLSLYRTVAWLEYYENNNVYDV
jgi:hypothetical protein